MFSCPSADIDSLTETATLSRAGNDEFRCCGCEGNQGGQIRLKDGRVWGEMRLRGKWRKIDPCKSTLPTDTKLAGLEGPCIPSSRSMVDKQCRLRYSLRLLRQEQRLLKLLHFLGAGLSAVLRLSLLQLLLSLVQLLMCPPHLLWIGAALRLNQCLLRLLRPLDRLLDCLFDSALHHANPTFPTWNLLISHQQDLACQQGRNKIPSAMSATLFIRIS